MKSAKNTIGKRRVIGYAPAIRQFPTLLLILALFPLPASSQSSGGSLIGRVSDERDAPLKGATVTAIHSPSGFSRTIKTASDGRYRFPWLPPGTYEVEVNLPGYASVTMRKIDVALAINRIANVRMRRTEVEEQLTVTAPVRQNESTPA